MIKKGLMTIFIMEVRKARQEDVDAIIELWKEFMKYHDEVVIKLEPRMKDFVRMKPDASDNFRDFISKQIKNENSLVLVAYDKGEPAGYCLSMIRDNVPVYEVEKMGYISDLYVPMGHRAKGISTQFKDRSIEWFRKKGMRYASIQVFAQNKIPHQIYSKWGFMDEHIRMVKKI
jgi:GNAT superfamily N-acetyltransferase